MFSRLCPSPVEAFHRAARAATDLPGPHKRSSRSDLLRDRTCVIDGLLEHSPAEHSAAPQCLLNHRLSASPTCRAMDEHLVSINRPNRVLPGRGNVKGALRTGTMGAVAPREQVLGAVGPDEGVDYSVTWHGRAVTRSDPWSYVSSGSFGDFKLGRELGERRLITRQPAEVGGELASLLGLPRATGVR